MASGGPSAELRGRGADLPRHWPVPPTADLAADVELRLRRIAAEDVAAWCKLGPVVFRSRSITERSGRIEVSAPIRDEAVLARIEAMRADRWGRGYEGLFTYRGRVGEPGWTTSRYHQSRVGS